MKTYCPLVCPWGKKKSQLGNHLVTLLDPKNGVVDKLVDDGLGWLLFVDDSSALAHEVRAELLKRVIAVIVIILGVVVGAGSTAAVAFDSAVLTASFATHVLLEVDLVGNGALGNKLLHLLATVRLPVFNVRVLADTHGATGEDDGTDVVVVAGSADGILVSLGGAGLISQDEAGTDPDTAGAHHESGSEELTVVNTTGGDDLYGAPGNRGLVTLDSVDDGGNQHSGGNVTSVTTTLTALSADNVDAELEALLDVLDVADHVHVQDTGLLQLLDDMSGGDTDGGDEQLGAGLDDNVDELIELALGVVVVGLSGVATNLGQKQIDTEGSLLVGQGLLELGNLLTQHVGGVTDTTYDAQTAGIGNGCSQLGTSSNVHTSQQDGMLDLEQLGNGGANLLRRSHLVWFCGAGIYEEG